MITLVGLEVNHVLILAFEVKMKTLYIKIHSTWIIHETAHVGVILICIKILNMHNLINWLEIPASDFSRAVTFYKTLLQVEMTESEVYGTKMAFFPSDNEHVSGAVVQGEDYKPSIGGVLIYIHGGRDLQDVLNRVMPAGGTVLVPKTQISPEMGYFALFIDTEGNKLGLHSMA